MISKPNESHLCNHNQSELWLQYKHQFTCCIILNLLSNKLTIMQSTPHLLWLARNSSSTYQEYDHSLWHDISNLITTKIKCLNSNNTTITQWNKMFFAYIPFKVSILLFPIYIAGIHFQRNLVTLLVSYVRTSKKQLRTIIAIFTFIYNTTPRPCTAFILLTDGWWISADCHWPFWENPPHTHVCPHCAQDGGYINTSHGTSRNNTPPCTCRCGWWVPSYYHPHGLLFADSMFLLFVPFMPLFACVWWISCRNERRHIFLCFAVSHLRITSQSRSSR